jgi:hypothetical protein
MSLRLNESFSFSRVRTGKWQNIQIPKKLVKKVLSCSGNRVFWWLNYKHITEKRSKWRKASPPHARKCLTIRFIKSGHIFDSDVTKPEVKTVPWNLKNPNRMCQEKRYLLSSVHISRRLKNKLSFRTSKIWSEMEFVNVHFHWGFWA